MVLEQAWSQAARGERAETIEAGVVELADSLAARWVELSFPNGIEPRSPYFGVDGSAPECTESVVHSDVGAFRLRQTAHVVDLGVLPTRWARAEFNRKNSNGKYKAERADHIELEAQFFGLGDLGSMCSSASSRKIARRRSRSAHSPGPGLVTFMLKAAAR